MSSEVKEIMFIERLKEICELKYKDIMTEFDNCILKVINELRIIPYYFVHFSRHDQSHSEKIIQYLEALLGETCINKLTASDLLMILLSCYTHDLGMALSFEEIEKKFSEEEFSKILEENIDTNYADLKEIVKKTLEFPEPYKECQTKDLAKIYAEVTIVIENVFRKGHAARSKERILNNKELRDLLGDRIVFFLADICSLHDQDICNILNLPQEENGLFSDCFHPRFIAALLCLGDLLDLDTDRFDETMLKASSDMPVLSELHKQKHESVTHYLVKDKFIEVKANCKSIEVYRIMRQWMDWMKSACDFMILHWDEITPNSTILPPRIKQSDILINGNSKWNDYANLKLNVNTAKVLKLLEGSNIYYGKDVFVRELLQNAIDATLIQLFLDAEHVKHTDGIVNSGCSFEEIIYYIRSGRLNINNYDIKGRFFLNPQNGKVIVEITDRGPGISTSEIKVIAGLRGKSKELKKIITRMPKFLRPAGAFGIGLQSVFQVANKIEFYTKTDNEEPKKITIEDPASTGYIYVEDAEGISTRGTKVVVTLDTSKFDQTDLGKSDYDYQTRHKEETILVWLGQRCCNTLKDILPLFEIRNQLTDYFNVRITGRLNYDENDTIILKRSSIFQKRGNKDEKQAGKRSIENGEDLKELEGWLIPDKDNLEIPTIRNNYSTIYYNLYDRNNECMFEAQITITDYKFNKDGSIELGRLEHIYDSKYRKSVWYRNSFVEDNMLRDRFRNDGKLFELIDYRINLFSDNADEVLNLDRRKVRASYNDRLENLIKAEIERMCVDIINYSLKQEYGGEKTENYVTAFLVYYLSIAYKYKIAQVKEKFESFLKKIIISNFFTMDGKEYNIPLLDLTKKQYLFFKEIKQIPEIDFHSMSALKNDIVNYDTFVSGDCFLCLYEDTEAKRHIFDFWLKEEVLAKKDNKLWHAFLTTVKIGGVEAEAAKRNEFYIYRDFLNVILNGVRVVNACSGFEILATPLSEGLHNIYYRDHDKMIEVLLDEQILINLQSELNQFGYIRDAEKRFLDIIINTERYKKNIDFIFNYHLRVGNNEITKTIIEEKYKEFYKWLISLLEKEDYKQFCKEFIEASKIYNMNMRSFNDNLSYNWNKYSIFRFC